MLDSRICLRYSLSLVSKPDYFRGSLEEVFMTPFGTTFLHDFGKERQIWAQ
jgi:hypothetical protein